MPDYPIQQLLDDLARALTPDDFDRAAQLVHTAFDELNARIIARKSLPLACGAGCSICCSLRVDVFAHEIFPIVHHLRRHFSAEENARVLQRLAAHAEKVRPLTPFEHATQNHTCPLLENGRCSIYHVRPQSCRRHHSQDLAACQYTYDHPADVDTPAAHDRELFRTLTAAMRENIETYAQLGYDHTFYELGTALHEALTDPTCEPRWRDHAPAFHHASVTPAE